ncbi:MAG TPA: aldo/keto reductase [Gemmatimonadota bacterium]|nr:aldo/keto reductase [Gemmatimonadota bacterium]
MRTTGLGETDLRTSRVWFGTWQFGGDWRDLDRRRAIDAVRRAREIGIDAFDTAQAYGFGASEELLAEALGPELRRARDELVLATKGGLRRENGRLLRDASPSWLRAGLEESLRHLDVDHVDLYQVHWPDPDTPIEETAAALASFVEEGKVRYVGVSNFDVARMEAFREGGRLDALQPPYHMLRRGIEDRVLPYCREHGIGVLCYGPLAHGLLTGKYGPGTRFPEDDWRHGSALFRGEPFRRNLAVVERLSEVASAVGCTLPQLAVAWTLANPEVDVAIAGAREPGHIEETAAAADIDLEADVLERIERILEDAAPVGGPTPEGA